jgi:hypothetical protein
VAFVAAFGSPASAGAACRVIPSIPGVVMAISPSAVNTAVTTSITLVACKDKRILREIEKAMEWRWWPSPP